MGKGEKKGRKKNEGKREGDRRALCEDRTSESRPTVSTSV